MITSVFRDLTKLFTSRFLESDALAEGAGFETNIWQILGCLATPGFFITMYMAPTYAAPALNLRPGYEWELRADHLFFAAYSFAVTGFATLFEWDMLFPDRRDFLVLTPFPIRMRELFAAKLSALGLFLVTIATAANALSMVLVPLLSRGLPGAREAGFLRVLGAQIVSTAGPAVFAFLAVAALQGVLVNILTPRFFRRISPGIQMAGMSLMVLSLLLFPLYSMTMRTMAQTHPAWLIYFPPYWFTGAYELLVPGPGALFASIGVFGLKATAVAAAVFGAAWALGYGRHYRRTLESEDSAARNAPRVGFDRLIGSPAERAVFRFTLLTLKRSAKHRLFLATWLSVGLSFGILTLVSLTRGVPGISRDGARAFPLLMIFFIVSGFRAAFQFPAELPSNWIFRIAESGLAETARRATRKSVLAAGILPALVVFAPFEIALNGAAVGLFHVVFAAACGALLVELLFWNFDRVPFTCSYFPGKLNLALLGAAYLYGFTSYSFEMADLEEWLEVSVARAAAFLVLAVLALGLFRRRNSPSTAIRFDGSEPSIQVLDLT